MEVVGSSLCEIENPFRFREAYAGPLIRIHSAAGSVLMARVDEAENIVAVLGDNLFQWPTLYWVEPDILRMGGQVFFVPLDPCLMPITTNIVLIGGCGTRALERLLIESAKRNCRL